MFFVSTKVFAGSISLVNKNVPLNLYQYDVNNFGGQYYDFNFTFKVADNPPVSGSPNDINADSYFEADINSKRLDLRGVILKSGLSEAPAEIIANSSNGVMYVTKMNADENKGKTIEKTVRIPMALLFSITKENNVPFHWKIYNANPDFNGNYNEIYASGTIKLADDPVSVTPKINVAENKSIYKMLVPLPGITCMDSSGQDPNCIPNDIGKYLNFIFKFAIGLCAALAVIMLIIAGVSYMGDESVFGKTEAKKKMFSAILGLIIALGAWALLNTINPDLTGKNGLVIDTASVEIQPNSIYVKEATPQNTARCTPITSGPCTIANLSIFGSQAESMSKICNIESSGNQNAVSGTDKGTDGNAFSFGLFQINLLANGKIIKDSKGETCEGLFVRTSDEKPTPPNKYINNGTYDAKLKTGMEAKYDDCKKTLLNPTKNIEAAKLLSNSTLSAWRGSDIKVCASAFQ